MISFEAIGTTWTITTPHPLDDAVLAEIHLTIDGYDRAFSRFRPDSIIMAAARAPGRFALPTEADDLFALYWRLNEITDGAINPLVGNSLTHLGYDADYGFSPLPGYLPAPHWADVCEWDGEFLTTTAPVVIDVGAVGKGQLVDLVTEVLRHAGVDEVTVDAGGDIRHYGPTSTLRVGLEHPSPDTAGTLIGVIELGSGAVCGSAPNRRTWGTGLHHVLDARTGVPTTSTAATWGVAPTAMLADASASALFFTGFEELGRLAPNGTLENSIHGVAMLDDGHAAWSTGFPGEIFTEDI